MKYDLKAFDSAVKYYEKHLKKFKKKNIFVVLDTNNEKAFFSIAPLSRAAHNLGCDMGVRVIQKTSKALNALVDIWNVFDDLEKGVKNNYTKALDDFIKSVDKKAKGKFRKLFKRPEVFVHANNNEFFTNQGFRMDFKPQWFKKYKWDKLLETGEIIWDQVYNLKKDEKVGMGFDLIMKASDMQYPLEDYFDSYAIARTMFVSCHANEKSMSTYSSRKTQLEDSERTSELASTILGCELEKNIDEPWFKKYKILSKLLKLERFEPANVTFFAKGEGEPGKHVFGESIGYPTPNKKSRWSSAGGIVFQLPWAPQTKIDSRAPVGRVAFTDTVPINIFIDTCHIDWFEMKRKNDALAKIANMSDKFIVESSKSNFEVHLIGKKGKRRIAMNSDVDVREKLDPLSLKKGIKAGTFGNIPGGEMFVTPEYIKGMFYGDVVISIDKSYALSSKNPLVIKCNEQGYKIVKGPKKVVDKINEKKKESMKILKMQEKNKSLPKDIIKLKKDNFNKIGEFAINTNPKAKLCNYLIINEKIAGMIHIALGSGFEEDRSGLYHYDIVINAKEQKLDIYGVKGNKKFWAMKKGKLIV
ncbi:MAG: hypothetical protein KKF46_02040 [Nanoarchaeota archaeon]|nr:hypothetical protein [Nanoarchaeota archaeon]MBU1321114.1 hypothetical protein [Nanoarchaeota archaeon]MBU1597490.1 hypothetical protein [Nanoarchaeota archaeon]